METTNIKGPSLTATVVLDDNAVTLTVTSFNYALRGKGALAGMAKSLCKLELTSHTVYLPGTDKDLTSTTRYVCASAEDATQYRNRVVASLRQVAAMAAPVKPAKAKRKVKAKPKADPNHAANLALRACDYAVAIISADLSPLAKGVLTAAFNEAHKAALKEVRK